MLPLSPALFIAAASALLPRDKTVEVSPVAVDDDLVAYHPLERDNHGPDDPVTTAAFIAHVGYWSHRRELGKSTWPFGIDADCDALAEMAADRRVLHLDEPHAGAILLRKSVLLDRFTRASIVLSSTDVLPIVGGGWSWDCLVIEGSVRIAQAEPGSEAEYRAKLEWVRRVRRRFCPRLGDRVVSWMDLDRRGKTVHIRRAA